MKIYDVTSIGDLTQFDYIDTDDLVDLQNDLQSRYDESQEEDADPELQLNEEELELLEFLNNTAKMTGGDWGSVTLISEGEFQSYVTESALESMPEHPLNEYIDWEQYAKDQSSNYSVVEIDGIAYYYQ